MDEMMNSVSVPIQRAINDAISNQVLPQIRNVIKAGSGQLTKNAWNVPSEGPEINPEVQRNLSTKNNQRIEQDEGRPNGDLPSRTVHDRSPFNFLTFCNISSSIYCVRIK